MTPIATKKFTTASGDTFRRGDEVPAEHPELPLLIAFGLVKVRKR